MRSMEHGVDEVVGVRQIVTVWTVLPVMHSNMQDYLVETLRNNTCGEIITGTFQKVHRRFHYQYMHIQNFFIMCRYAKIS